MKETIEFETAHDIENAAIVIERTPDFFQAAQQLSEFVHGLPLDQPTNDRLVALMVNQVQHAEKGAFAHGFCMGMIFAGRDHGKPHKNTGGSTTANKGTSGTGGTKKNFDRVAMA